MSKDNINKVLFKPRNQAGNITAHFCYFATVLSGEALKQFQLVSRIALYSFVFGVCKQLFQWVFSKKRETHDL